MKIKDINQRFKTYPAYTKYGICDIIYQTYKDKYADESEISLDVIQAVINKHKKYMYYKETSKSAEKVYFDYTSVFSANIAGHIITSFKSKDELFKIFIDKDITKLDTYKLPKSIAPFVTKNCNAFTREYYDVDYIYFFSNIVSTITPNKFAGFFSMFIPDLYEIGDYISYFKMIDNIKNNDLKYCKYDSKKKIHRPKCFYHNYEKYIKWKVDTTDESKIQFLNIKISITKFINESENISNDFIVKLKKSEWYQYSQIGTKMFKFDEDMYDVILNSEYNSFNKYLYEFKNNDFEKSFSNDKKTFNAAMGFFSNMNSENLNKILYLYNITFSKENGIINNYKHKHMKTELIVKTEKLGINIKDICYRIANDYCKKYPSENIWNKRYKLISSIKKDLMYSDNIVEFYNVLAEFGYTQKKQTINISISEMSSCDGYDFEKMKQLFFIELMTTRVPKTTDGNELSEELDTEETEFVDKENL